jgi:flagellar protein FlaG
MFDKEILFRASEYKPGPGSMRAPPAAGLTSNTEASTDTAEAAQASRARPLASTTTLEKALGNVSAQVQMLQRSLHFSVDKESGEPIVRIVDTETQELIRQIPSQELLAIGERLRSTIGLLLSEEV